MDSLNIFNRRVAKIIEGDSQAHVPGKCYLSDDEGSSSETGSSDDDDPIPETAGQIKVALFRVLASGEIKRGEYSPQFDAHDDSEGSENGEGAANGKADVDHTTSFAKPKSSPATIDTMITTKTITTIEYVTSSWRDGQRTLRISETLSRTNRVGAPPRPFDGRAEGDSVALRVAVTAASSRTSYWWYSGTCAGATGLEPATAGFGDRCSTN